MGDYLIGMIARSEHQRMIGSLLPVRDFDVRGQEAQPGWIVRQISRLVQWVRGYFISVKRKRRERTIYDISMR